MPDSTEHVTVQIVELLRKKREYVQTLRQLALKQGEAIKNKNPEALSELLGARETVMEEIDRLNGELTGGRNKGPLPEHTNNNKPLELPVKNSDTGRLTEEIDRLLRETQSIDFRNIESAGGLRDEIRDELKSVSLHKKSREAYGGGKGEKFVGAFLNRES